jgi:hypothetical protein
MQEKPTTWAYVTTTLLLIAFATWAFYDYKNDPTKIPFEPSISAMAAVLTLVGYLFWQKDKSEPLKGSNSTATIQQTVHTNNGQVVGTVETLNINNAAPTSVPQSTPQ